MHIVAIAWIFVVVLMAAAEASAANGSLLGGLFTLLLYGALPLSIVLYVMGTPARRRARQRAETQTGPNTASADPDGRRVAAGDAIPPEREEP